MLCIISDFIVSLGKFLMHLCLALHTEEKKNFVMATVVWDFQVTKKKKKQNGKLLLLIPNNDALLLS